MDADEVNRRLMAAGDERSAKAQSERDRGQALRADGKTRQAELASGHAWALRNQADGLWEAASIVRRMAEEDL